MPPTVTVITPVFNALQTLERTVASVRGQDFADWELLLSDDGSTDGSVALADRLAAEDPRIRVLRCETNGGAARARNRALDAARGRYIAFLDSDDEWVPHKQLIAERNRRAKIVAADGSRLRKKMGLVAVHGLRRRIAGGLPVATVGLAGAGHRAAQRADKEDDPAVVDGRSGD